MTKQKILMCLNINPGVLTCLHTPGRWVCEQCSGKLVIFQLSLSWREACWGSPKTHSTLTRCLVGGTGLDVECLSADRFQSQSQRLSYPLESHLLPAATGVTIPTSWPMSPVLALCYKHGRHTYTHILTGTYAQPWGIIKARSCYHPSIHPSIHLSKNSLLSTYSR